MNDVTLFDFKTKIKYNKLDSSHLLIIRAFFLYFGELCFEILYTLFP
jgi:hypothetical protein